MVFDRHGEFPERSFGGGVFSKRTHGIFIGPDDSVSTAPTTAPTPSRKFTPRRRPADDHRDPPASPPGKLERPAVQPAHPRGGLRRKTGDIFVIRRIRQLPGTQVQPATAATCFPGGSPASTRGSSYAPTTSPSTPRSCVYVADRECHRVQVFDTEGGFVTMWNNIHRPDGLISMGPDGNIYIGELNGMAGVDEAPGLGHRGLAYTVPKGEMLARFGDSGGGRRSPVSS